MPDKPAAMVMRRRLRSLTRFTVLQPLFIPFPRHMIARGGTLRRKRKF